MSSNAILAVVIVASLATALIAYEAYLQSQNNTASNLGKFAGGALSTLFGGGAL